LKVKGVDLVWGTSPPIFQGITAWAVARIHRVPFLFEVRDLWPAFAVAVGVLKNPLLIRLSEWLERFLYRQADRVVINSPGFAEHVKARGATRVELVPNGADTRMFDPYARGESFRQKHGLSNQFIALYAGAHGLSNDLGVVLDAAAQLRDCPEVTVVLLGDGKEKPALLARAKKERLDNVFFIPSIPKNEMGEALAAADACIGILKPVEMYKTVYPNKIFDYLAAGRPVVLAMEGVIREVVQAADAGIVIPPGDAGALAEAVRLLVNNCAMGQRMGLSGRAFMEQHFDRGKLAEKLRVIVEGAARQIK
jgi:glycosyltransferase involved in cell wall biosynthesis